MTGWPGVVMSVKWIPDLISYSSFTKSSNEINKNLLFLYNFPCSTIGYRENLSLF